MAYFQVEATWRPDQTGGRLEVDLAFYQLVRSADDKPTSLGDLMDGEFASVRRLVGTAKLAPKEPPTLLRVRRAALDWLRDHMSMRATDSFELRTATQADLAFLDRLAALALA